MDADAPEAPVQHGGENVSVEPSITRAAATDFDVLAVVGKGTYGKVYQVQHKASRGYFAMKVFDKQRLIKMKQVSYTKVERDIMTRVRHPFLVDLKCSFQSASKVWKL